MPDRQLDLFKWAHVTSLAAAIGLRSLNGVGRILQGPPSIWRQRYPIWAHGRMHTSCKMHRLRSSLQVKPLHNLSGLQYLNVGPHPAAQAQALHSLHSQGCPCCRRCRNSRLQLSAQAAAPAGGNGAALTEALTPSTPGTSSVSAPQPPATQTQASTTECAPPAETYDRLVAIGEAKANAPLHKTILLSLMAGAFVGFGAMMVLAVGAACPGLASTNPGLQKLVMGAFGLPMGLLCVLVTGAELFTGNTMMLPLAVIEGKATLTQLVRNWSISFAGNLLGSVGLVYLVSVSGLLTPLPGPAKMAAAKTSLSFIQAFTRGVIANWMVCLAVWLATSASSLPGKALGAWFPVSAFAATGAEHSVANMFSIPMGIIIAREVSWGSFFNANLLPVVMGNIIGGALCVAVGFSACYGRLSGTLQQGTA